MASNLDWLTMHLTGSESTVLAAGITAIGYFTLAHRQKPIKDASTEARDLVASMKDDIKDLRHTFASHTEDDAANFRQIRDLMAPRRSRRNWILPALAVIAKLFL